MSRRKQSRPVKVLEDEEDCSGAVSPGEPGAVHVVVNGHHDISTSTRRFDDGAISSMTSEEEDDEENGPIHGEKLPRMLANTCRQCAMGFLSYSELSEHNKTCVLHAGTDHHHDTAASEDFDHQNEHDLVDEEEDDGVADEDDMDDDEDVVTDDYHHGHHRHYNAAGLQPMAVATAADIRNARNNNNNNNSSNQNNNKAHEERRRQRQDAENNNRRYGGGQETGEDLIGGGAGGMVADETAAMIPAGFPFAAAYQAAVAAAAATDGPALLPQQQQAAAAAVGHHVTLEALQNTKVAVAQFAATAMAINNGAASNPNVLQDLAMVNSTLYTLQHQQMMQLSLIQQLRQQLQISRRGGSVDGNLSVSPPLLSDGGNVDETLAAIAATSAPLATPSPNDIPLSLLAISRNNAELLQQIQQQQQQQQHIQQQQLVTRGSPPTPVLVPMQPTGDCTTQTPCPQQPLSRSLSPASSCTPTPPPPPSQPTAAAMMTMMLPELQRPIAATGGVCPPSPLQALQTSISTALPPSAVQPVAAAATATTSSSTLSPYASSPIVTHHHSIPSCSVSSAFASSIITNLDPPPSPSEPNTLEMLQRRAQEVLDKASQGLLANNLADELSFRKSSGSGGGKGSSLSPYDGKSGSGSRGDNFYKHRCRYCGKVFGSDSALQIHIRSHTGERPFKCNVCGSRFTTKGNLKVHFQRHTSKFPNVKMNALPVPEHLDREFPPLMPPHLNQSPQHQHNNCGGPLHVPQPPTNSSGAATPRSPQSHQFSTASSPSFPTALSGLFRSAGIGGPPQPQPQHQSSSSDVTLPSNIQLLQPSQPQQQQPQQPTAEQFLTMNHQQHQHQSSLHHLFRFKHEQDQPENLSKPANVANTCSSRESSNAASPSPLSESSMTRNNNKDEYVDDMAVDIDSADVDDGRHQNDMDGNMDDFSVDTKYSGEEERTNSPGTNDDGLQDQPENLSNKSGRATMMTSNPPSITSDESYSPRPGSSSSRHHGSRPGSPASMSFNNGGRYSPPCALDLTPKQSALAATNHIISAYLPPAFATGLLASTSTSSAGLQGHGPSFAPSAPRGNTTCNICFKTFACHSALEIHYRSHTKERPYKCSVCDRGFSTKGNMKQHMLTHKTRDGGGGGSSSNMFDGNNSTSCGHDDTASNASSESRDASSQHQHHMQHHHQQQMMLLSAAVANNVAAAAAAAGQATTAAGAVAPPPSRSLPLPLPPPPPPPSTAMSPLQNCTSSVAITSANASTGTGTTMVTSGSVLSPTDLSAQSQQPPATAKSTVPPPPPPPPAPAPAPAPVTLSVPVVGQLFGSVSHSSGSRKAPAAAEGHSSSSSSSPKRSVPEPDTGMPAAKRQPSSPKHLCQVCNKNFSSSSALQIHMRTHTGDKPFRCTVCLKAFTTKGNLKVHMGTHMWTNGTSRRGRRMSLELPPLTIANNVKETDFLQRRPDIYYNPFLPSPFLNGIHQQKINEISVIQNVNSNVNNRILSGFGNFGGTFPGGGDMMKQEPGTPASDNQKQSPPSSHHHIRTPPLWDLHFDRQSAAAAVNLKSSAADDHHHHQLNNCGGQQSPPQPSPMAHANHISQNRTEGLAT